MNDSSATTFLSIWEQGQSQHPVDRALTVLQYAFPQSTRNELADLSIGERDSRLLQFRREAFGDKVQSVADCPNCTERVEVSFNVDEVRVPPEPQRPSPEEEFQSGDYRIQFRLPNSWDMAALVQQSGSENPVNTLLGRCLVRASRHKKTIGKDELPEQVVQELVEHIAESDPQAEIFLNLKCPECGQSWEMLFDIVPILWEEIVEKAQRLIGEIHALAANYGWSEQEILNLSPQRRRIYLEHVFS
jgi:T4 bacteriophage base plate protein